MRDLVEKVRDLVGRVRDVLGGAAPVPEGGPETAEQEIRRAIVDGEVGRALERLGDMIVECGECGGSGERGSPILQVGDPAECDACDGRGWTVSDDYRMSTSREEAEAVVRVDRSGDLGGPEYVGPRGEEPEAGPEAALMTAVHGAFVSTMVLAELDSRVFEAMAYNDRIEDPPGARDLEWEYAVHALNDLEGVEAAWMADGSVEVRAADADPEWSDGEPGLW